MQKKHQLQLSNKSSINITSCTVYSEKSMQSAQLNPLP